MGKKKGQTERTRVSAHEDRLKLNGVAWAAKLGIPTDEEFWAKWATLDDATVSPIAAFSSAGDGGTPLSDRSFERTASKLEI